MPLILVGCASFPAELQPASIGIVPDTVTAANGSTVIAAELDSFVNREMERLEMPGLSIAVIDNGEIVYSRANGVADLSTGDPVTSASIFEAASLSKPVFAYFVLRLVEQGLLDLDRPLYEYVPMPELAHEPLYRKITARMALSHRTGFPNWRWFDPAPAELNIPRGTMYMKRAPGTFGYSGEGYNYLAIVVARLLDRDLTTLDPVFQQEVARPLGMDHSAFVQTPYIAEHKVRGHRDGKPTESKWPQSFPEDTPETFGSAGRLHTEARAYARFLIALMNGAGLERELWEEMFREQSQVPLDSDTHRLTGETGWSLGLAIEPTPYGTRFEHGGNNGGFQSGFMIFPERKMGYVFFTNSDRGEEFNRSIERFLTEGS